MHVCYLQTECTDRRTFCIDSPQAIPDTPEFSIKDYRSPRSVDQGFPDIVGDSPAVERVWSHYDFLACSLCCKGFYADTSTEIA